MCIQIAGAVALTIAIHKLIKIKSLSLQKFRRIQSAHHWQRYKQLRNLTVTAICKEKQFFLSSSYKHNSSRQFWRNLFSFSGYTSFPFPSPIHLLNPLLLNNHFIDSLPSNHYPSILSIISYSPPPQSVIHLILMLSQCMIFISF